MLPVIFTTEHKVLVQGNGPATKNRILLLEEAGMPFTHVEEAIKEEGNYELVFIADFDDETSETLYNHYKSTGALVNVEDKKRFCDFHVPARVRRGDLLLTVSTGGGSPRVARRIRHALEQLFPEKWKEKLNQLAKEREGWKKEGASFTELATRTDAWLDHEKLLEADCACLKANEKEAA